MNNKHLQLFLLISTLLTTQLSSSASSSTSSNPWYNKAADAFKNPHDTRAIVGDITTTGILIHQEGALRCEALRIMDSVNWVVAFHKNTPMQMLFADVTEKSDLEINESARILFEQLKTQYQK